MRCNLQKILCLVGLHEWSKTRRGNRFVCGSRWNFGCGKERAWRKGDR